MRKHVVLGLEPRPPVLSPVSLSHMLCATGMVTICAAFMPRIVIICHCDEKARLRASEEGHCLTHTV